MGMRYAWLAIILILIASSPGFSAAPLSTIASSTKSRYVVGFTDEGVVRDISNISGAEVIKVIREIRAAVIMIPADAVDRIKGMRGVRYIEPDYEARALETFSGYSDVLWNVRIINADKAWDTYYPKYGWSALGFGVIVAVLDTGIYYKHPELAGKVKWCANTLGPLLRTGDLDFCIDRNGHGTHVAGIIASTINNMGNAGVAPNVSLYAIKVLNDGGVGTYSDVAEGIIVAVKGPDGDPGTPDDAKILSMSLGGPSNSSVLKDAVEWAYNHGAIIVAAAGNSGDGDPSTDNILYPARYDHVIAVGAMDQYYNVPIWSSDGPELDVVAPGVRVYSTYPTYRFGGYATLSGTSMATPHVSATVALIQALRIASGKNMLTFEQVYGAITKTAKDLGSPGFDNFTGYGALDALASIEYALSMFP